MKRLILSMLFAFMPMVASANCPPQTIQVGLSDVPAQSILYFEVQFKGKPLQRIKILAAEGKDVGITLDQWIFDHQALQSVTVTVTTSGRADKHISLTEKILDFENVQLPAYHRAHGADACVRTTLAVPY